jgi:CHASE2 domain-containing sensor protein
MLYSPATTIAYLVWVLALGTLLVAISFRVRRNPHLREIWIPIALVGAILINPRIREYDIAPLTVPLFLIAWRSLRLGQERVTQWRAGRVFGFLSSVATQTQPHYRKSPFLIVAGAGLFVACNLIKILWEDWIPIQLAVLLLVFSMGYWSLRRCAAVPENSLGD